MFANSQALSRASHELRTPLNAILGFGQLLALDELDESQRHNVDQIMAGGRHLLALIEDLLDVSRLDAAGLDLGPVDTGRPDRGRGRSVPATRGRRIADRDRRCRRRAAVGARRRPPAQAGAAQPDLQRDQVQPSRRLDHDPRPARRSRRRPHRRNRLGRRDVLPAAHAPVPAVRATGCAGARHRGQRARPGRLEVAGRGDERDDRRRVEPGRGLGVQRPAARRPRRSPPPASPRSSRQPDTQAHQPDPPERGACPTDPGRCQMYSVPPVEWSFPLPTGRTIRPPTTIGLFQWPPEAGASGAGARSPGCTRSAPRPGRRRTAGRRQAPDSCPRCRSTAGDELRARARVEHVLGRSRAVGDEQWVCPRFTQTTGAVNI